MEFGWAMCYGKTRIALIVSTATEASITHSKLEATYAKNIYYI